VHSHSHLELGVGTPVLGRERRLRSDGRTDGGAGAVEDREERVALAVDSSPACRFEGPADQPVVRREELAVAIAAERLQQLRRALDVGEDEGDGAGRKRLSSFAQI
jgi:hypothetical protein